MWSYPEHAGMWREEKRWIRWDRDGMIHPRLRALDPAAKERDGSFHGALWSDPQERKDRDGSFHGALWSDPQERDGSIDRSNARDGTIQPRLDGADRTRSQKIDQSFFDYFISGGMTLILSSTSLLFSIADKFGCILRNGEK